MIGAEPSRQCGDDVEVAAALGVVVEDARPDGQGGVAPAM